MNLVGKGGFLIERGYISEAAQLLRWGTAAAQSLGITQVEALFTNKLSTILPPAPEQEQAGTPEIWDREEEEADEIQQDRSPTDDALETIGAQQGAPTIETPIPTLPEQESSPDEGQPLKPPPLNMEALEKLRQQEQAGSEEPEVEEEEAAPDEGQPLKPPPLNMDALEKLRQQEQGAPSTTETPPPAPPETLPEQESESDEGQPLKPPPLNMDALKEMQAASEAGTRTMPDEGVSEKSLLYAIEQAQESGDKDVEFGLYIQMGDMYMDKRHPADAVPVYEKALQLAAQDPENELAALHKLAAAELESGSPEDAAQHAQQGLIIARRIGDAGREADLLMEMGDSLLAQGTADAAAEYYGQASVRYQDVGIGQGEAWALVNQGDVYCDADRFTDAMTTFERALEIFRSLGDSEGEEQALLQMGHCRFAFGHTEDAIGAFFHAVRSARDRGDLSVAAFYLKDLSHLQDRAREIPAAIVTMRQALSLAYQGGDDALLTDILLMLGRMLMDDISDIGIAINVLEEVQNDPTGEAERLYKRCEARMERLSRAGYSIVRSPGPSIREYADAAWEM
jgi:tetratricopeptide (TPR) repeat protein